MAGGCGQLGAPDGYLVACSCALGGSIKANAKFGAVRLPGRPLQKAQKLFEFSVLFCSLRLGSQELALCEAIRAHFWFLIFSTREMQASLAIFAHLGVACPMVRFNA